MEEKKVFFIEFGVGGGVNDTQEEIILAEDKSEAESIASQNAEHLFFDTWEETLCSCKEDLDDEEEDLSDEEEDLSDDFQCQCVDSWITFDVIEITEENIKKFTDEQIEEYNKLKNEL